MRLFAAIATLVSVVSAASRTSPPAGAIVVSKSPSSGQFSTIQKAVDSLSTTSTSAQSIFIYQGTYTEQVLIPARAAKLSIYGYTTDTTSYKSNTVTVTFNKDAGSAGSNDASGTLRNKADNAQIYNIKIANTYGQGSQAIALSAYASKQGYYGVELTGYQDTLLANSGTQFYGNSRIIGRTDFIFGRSSPAWFEGCDIGVLAGGTGWVTASGRQDTSSPNYYVFNKCSVAAAPGNTVEAGAYYLGRPWGEYARVVFQNSVFSNVINSAGWAVWNTGDERTGHVEFGEYANSGDGSKGTRAGFSKKLGSAVNIGTILGSDFANWVDGDFY